MLKGGLVLIWELDMNLVPILVNTIWDQMLLHLTSDLK